MRELDMAGRTGKHLRMGGIYLCFLAVLLVCALMLHGIYISVFDNPPTTYIYYFGATVCIKC